MLTKMCLRNTELTTLLANFSNKQCNTLNSSDLGGGYFAVLILSNHSHTVYSGATRRHLTDCRVVTEMNNTVLPNINN